MPESECRHSKEPLTVELQDGTEKATILAGSRVIRSIASTTWIFPPDTECSLTSPYSELKPANRELWTVQSIGESRRTLINNRMAYADFSLGAHDAQLSTNDRAGLVLRRA